MRLRLSVILAMLVLPGLALAQPAQKPMQIIVPFAPGASADGIARIVAGELGARLNRQIVVESRPGAGGTLGLQLLSKAPPDGDTLAVGATGALVVSPHLPNPVSFDPLRELAPIAKLIDIPIVLVASPASGLKSLKDVIARSKAEPAGLNYGSTGVHSGQHLAIEMLKQKTGANLRHVPYRGSAPAVTDVLGGQIPLASVDLTSAHAHIKSGTLVALGVTSAARARIASDIPTFAEGGVAGYARAPGFIGLFAPAGTPPAVVKKLSQEIAGILARPEVQARIQTLSVEPGYQDDVQFARFLAAESADWKEALKSLPPPK